MGNCIETCKLQNPQTETNQNEEGKAGLEKGTEGKGENVKIKIVLTKKELERMMFELENRQGKGLEGVLDEIQRSRGKAAAAWKPSLESIIESPRVTETMER